MIFYPRIYNIYVNGPCAHYGYRSNILILKKSGALTMVQSSEQNSNCILIINNHFVIDFLNFVYLYSCLIIYHFGSDTQLRC